MILNKKVAAGVVLAAVLAISAGVFLYKGSRPFDPSVDIKTFTSAKQYDNYYKNLLEVYKKDTYGGKTPEETIELFIDALKNEDTELAAKYFVPEKQKKEVEDLKAGMESGGVKLLLSVLGKERRGNYFDDKKFYEASTFDENNIAEFSFRLVLNPYTNVWKIESL